MEEEKQRKADAAHRAFAAQVQRFRLDNEKFNADCERQEFDKREVDGRKLRQNVVKKKEEAASARRAEVRQHASDLKLKAEEEKRTQLLTEKQRRVEAEASRKAYDDQQREAEKKRVEAKALAEKMAKGARYRLEPGGWLSCG